MKELSKEDATAYEALAGCLTEASARLDAAIEAYNAKVAEAAEVLAEVVQD